MGADCSFCKNTEKNYNHTSLPHVVKDVFCMNTMLNYCQIVFLIISVQWVPALEKKISSRLKNGHGSPGNQCICAVRKVLFVHYQ